MNQRYRSNLNIQSIFYWVIHLFVLCSVVGKNCGEERRSEGRSDNAPPYIVGELLRTSAGSSSFVSTLQFSSSSFNNCSYTYPTFHHRSPESSASPTKHLLHLHFCSQSLCSRHRCQRCWLYRLASHPVHGAEGFT